jgi:formylglycine-generating enzyme required for sulfatase activity
MLRAGSLVFSPTPRPVSLQDWSQWWSFKFGADWRHPDGPGSSISGLDDHPVVHVAYPDALAYARWAGKQLPTESQWEYAARAGAAALPEPVDAKGQPHDARRLWYRWGVGKNGRQRRRRCRCGEPLFRRSPRAHVNGRQMARLTRVLAWKFRQRTWPLTGVMAVDGG